MFQLRMQFVSSLLENLNREDYESDEEYIDAAMNGAHRIVEESIKKDDNFFKEIKAQVKEEMKKEKSSEIAKEFQLGKS